MACPKIQRMLRQVGAVMIRKKKHEVWRLQNGAIFVCSSTASDVWAERNQLGDLNRLLRKEIQ